jgi:hypothetical protein
MTVRLSALYPQKNSFVRDLVDARAIAQLEGWKNTVILLGIEPPSFWLVAKYLNPLQ